MTLVPRAPAPAQRYFRTVEGRAGAGAEVLVRVRRGDRGAAGVAEVRLAVRARHVVAALRPRDRHLRTQALASTMDARFDLYTEYGAATHEPFLTDLLDMRRSTAQKSPTP